MATRSWDVLQSCNVINYSLSIYCMITSLKCWVFFFTFLFGDFRFWTTIKGNRSATPPLWDNPVDCTTAVWKAMNLVHVESSELQDEWNIVYIFPFSDTGCWNRPVELTKPEQCDGSFFLSLFWLGFLFISASSREWNQQERYVKHRWKPKRWKLTSVFLFAGGVFHSSVPIRYPDCPVNK